MKKNNTEKEQRHVPYASRFELALTVAVGCFSILLYAVISEIFPDFSVITAILSVLFFLAFVAVIGAVRKENAGVLPRKDVQSFLAEPGSTVFQNSIYPTLLIDSLGTVLWYNDSMRSLLPDGVNYVDREITDIFGENITVGQLSGEDLNIFGRTYTAESFVISEEERGLYMTVLTDKTDIYALENRYNDERTAVAYITIDNVEDVLQYVQDKFRDAVTLVDDKLKKWAKEMHGVIKTYDNDKYIMFFDSSYLEECIQNRFSILDSIRDTRVSDGISVTVSIGVSRVSGTLADREEAAKEAIDLALQRGGDQVVCKSDDGIEYYGGKTKSVYKRSNIRSRTFTSELVALIARSDNVLIMGHKYGDFDSFGACIGVARLAMLSGVKAEIVVNLRDNNLSPFIKMMQETDEYSQVFVDNSEGLDLIGPDTVLILVDHNTTQRSEYSDISEKVSRVVIIDHHRKIDPLEDKVVLSYIEPSASSTCELVTEMLECAVSSHSLLKEEADMLLSGILLDTKRFTRDTGTRTFGAAQYLRGAGASPADVNDMFKAEASDLAKEARFHTSITVYRSNIAISCCDKDTDDSFRVIASKAADRMLTLKGIDAAFALVQIGDQIHISGRSAGKINVQLILEKLNGGGHFDVAGAQVQADSVISVLEQLKSVIDEYFEEE